MANSTTAEHAVIRRDISKFKWTMMQMKQHKVAYLMIAPFFILFFIFTVVPVLLSIRIQKHFFCRTADARICR